MGIILRDLDASEGKLNKQRTQNTVQVTGSTAICFISPSNAVLKAVSMAAFGLSGVPHCELNILRFTSGGQTAISGIAATLVVTAFGTSGYQGFSLVDQGSTLMNLLTGDMVVVKYGNANTAILSHVTDVVVRAVGDYRQLYGSST